MNYLIQIRKDEKITICINKKEILTLKGMGATLTNALQIIQMIAQTEQICAKNQSEFSIQADI